MSAGLVSATSRTGTGRLVLALGGLSAASPFATDMYTPGFPQILASFGTSGTAVQLSLTACLVGLATGQVVLGPLSDAMGRRRLLLIGSILFTVLSSACALAPSIAVFNAARLLQGVAGSAGLVIGRAVISDRFTGAGAARQLSVLSVIAMTAPVLAPVAGGLLLGVGSWRLVFLALAASGLLLSVAVWAWVPESLPVEQRRSGGLRAAVVAMGGLLRRRELIGYLLVMGCGLAALFAYISGSPFVFQSVYGLSSAGYGLVFATNAVGTVAAGVLFGRLARRVRLNTLLVVGVAVMVVSVVGLAGLLSAGVSTFSGTWVCLFGVTFGFGLVLPAATTIILAVGGAAPGAASGLLGGAQFALGAVAAPLPGVLGSTTAASMTAVVLIFVLVSALALVVLARPWEGHGEPVGRS
ncbi:MFS transporter, DHA1 family, bicyclomycin/chloramphenicol resistance protein [Saccharopolyspora kobensis]|uniref:MFS transporter, DHA1 family, bicyclomycin/chloramphenicol resistance protein n=1 Tax=Saccharopolyspora kobensis TaxID=146035 RepID=A0A1H5WR59_9PSEU|nr:multidrug effflux MFS transporter [Saccharopolyspora kobensis]SEG01841.1 MFS transporter, DHA1 family, bicyclomycin/chloramphenicol resistance protein [Saccharopolyspora kobensis]SFD78574.1 MFS transporter, DHA1 family, bicyclomycin/chloramphenicol resistance protein [Saccharopolyspora kobensis]